MKKNMKDLCAECEVLTRHLSELTLKDIENYFPTLIDNIFYGTSTSETGWGLQTLTPNDNFRTCYAVRKFLAPDGPVFTAISSLMRGVEVRYNIPVHRLPKNIQESSGFGDSDPFSQSREAFISLNPLEFYFFHFAYQLVHPQKRRASVWPIPPSMDSVYALLTDDYMDHYLPTDGRPIPTSPVVHSSQRSPFSSIAEVGKPLPSTDTKPYLLRKTSAIQKLLVPEEEGVTEANQSANCWRTDTFLGVIMELWIRPFRLSQRTNMTQILPSQDHVRFIRNLIKRLHYFTNVHSRDSNLERRWFSRFTKPLYQWFEFLFEYWPVDASFKIILETWISYIQPWRYSDPSQANVVRSTECANIHAYRSFVAENLLFYSVFFRQLMVRLLRTDFTTFSSANMLFRVARVFDQESLALMLMELEMHLEQSVVSSQFSVIVRRHVQEVCEKASTKLPVFYNRNPEIREVVVQIELAIRSLQVAVDGVNKHKKNTSFVDMVLENFGYKSLNHGATSTVEDHKKTIVQLKVAHKHLTSILNEVIREAPEVGNMDLLSESAPCSPPLFLTHSQSQLDTSQHNVSAADLSQHMIDRELDQTPETALDDSGFTKLTEKGRFQVVNRLRSPQIKMKGNPDLQPVRSWENEAAVKFLQKISLFLNEKFSANMEELYERADFVGRVSRLILEEPRTCTVGTRVEELPARVCLRRAASYSVLLLAAFLLSAGYLLGYSPVSVILLSSFFFVLYVMVKAALQLLMERVR